MSSVRERSNSPGAVKPGAGVSAGLLVTTERTDGTTEGTYNGHSLSYYAGDSGPGQTTAQGLNQFGAKWYPLAATGEDAVHRATDDCSHAENETGG